MEIDTLGYLPPPADGTDGGSAALDVYVRDLGPSGYYGVATPDRLLRQVPTEIWTSFLEIDNNYNPTDSARGRPTFSTTGIDGLRITCAHEFHHAVQNGCYALVPQHRMLYELTSTWMEMRCWPEVRDWSYYAKDLLLRPERWPFARSSGQTGYVWAWFGNVLAQHPGQIMRTMWERIGLGVQPFPALVESCTERGASFSDLFCSAVESMYRTGSRGMSNPIIPLASELPEVAIASTLDVSGPGATFSGTILPFCVRAYRFDLSTASGKRSNADAVIALGDDAQLAADSLRERAIGFAMTLTSQPSVGDVSIASTGWGVSFDRSDLCLVVDGASLLDVEAPFPQPLELRQHNVLSVPIPGGFLGDFATLSLLDLSMHPVQEPKKLPIEITDRRVVANLSVDRNLAPGTYILFADDGRSAPPMMWKIFIR
ncbi:MAG: hypothetical protein FGM33_10490 [Candidatus Kapabacteria bacterium]|nr:hypothetical protein [Candidatus Kapabacteria bacterium]